MTAREADRTCPTFHHQSVTSLRRHSLQAYAASAAGLICAPKQSKNFFFIYAVGQIFIEIIRSRQDHLFCFNLPSEFLDNVGLLWDIRSIILPFLTAVNFCLYIIHLIQFVVCWINCMLVAFLWRKLLDNFTAVLKLKHENTPLFDLQEWPWAEFVTLVVKTLFYSSTISDFSAIVHGHRVQNAIFLERRRFRVILLQLIMSPWAIEPAGYMFQLKVMTDPIMMITRQSWWS